MTDTILFRGARFDYLQGVRVHDRPRPAEKFPKPQGLRAAQAGLARRPCLGPLCRGRKLRDSAGPHDRLCRPCTDAIARLP